MSERERLEQAIAALEAQRAVLGDAVVETALTPLREKLAALDVQPAEQQRKQVTVLFADVSGFTAMSETMDAEEVSDTMSALWERIDATVVEHGGLIDKHIGDAVMALWGVDQVREDDPERAIRAALAMQAELAAFREERDLQLAMRIGLNTGPVLLGEVRPGEFTAMGDAVNLASRMEHAAPIGGILIAHGTYRRVRGIFDVLPQEPITVKGKAEPVRTYIVERTKPRAFRMATRGVEGIETHMVGRDAELMTLQNTYRDVMEDAEIRVVTIVGEAGVGKSRLLYEFDNWIELLPEQIWYFKGRATPEMQAVSYGIIRDMFAYRFDIRESDSAATVLTKFRAGMADVLDADRTDLVGHFIGFDFSASQAVQNLLGSESFAELAMAYLTNYFRAMAAVRSDDFNRSRGARAKVATTAVGGPTVIFLEDVHWADDSSLDFIDHLVTAVPDALLLVVCLSRPPLFERRPSWGDPSAALRAGGRGVHTRIDIKPLSKRASRVLVADILQKMEDIPDDLCDLIVDGAEGNPFYVEELIKMLIEDGVIVRGEQRWQVELGRLAEVRVPPTLTGVLQARLDSLPREEKTLLQRASVVGRLFWDAAVAELKADDTDRIDRAEIVPLLDAVRGRELVFQRERSAFEGAEEYIFKHAILRDVTYETVLLKLRRVYHAQVAKWLEANAGERLGEYLSLIAGHYELARETAKAAEYLRRSGEELSKIGALCDAIGPFERALSLLPEGPMLPEGSVAGRAALLVELGRARFRVGDYSVAVQHLGEGVVLARKAGDPQTEVAALIGLSRIVLDQGRYNEAERHLERALALARESNNRAGIAEALAQASSVAFYQGNGEKAKRCAEDSLTLCRELGDQQGIASALMLLGVVSVLQGEGEKTKRCFEESLAVFREIGDQFGVARCLNNLGEVARIQGQYEEAVQYYEESLVITRELGLSVATQLNNLGLSYAGLGEDDVARRYLHEALRESWTVGRVPLALEVLIGTALLRAKDGQYKRAAELLGLVLAHPALNEEARWCADPALATLREALPAGELEAALVRGQALDLEQVVAEILAERP